MLLLDAAGCSRLQQADAGNSSLSLYRNIYGPHEKTTVMRKLPLLNFRLKGSKCGRAAGASVHSANKKRQKVARAETADAGHR